MTEPTALACIVCPALYPDRKPRLPTIEPVCDTCRERPRRELLELPDAYAQVARNLQPGRAGAGRAVGYESRLPLNGSALNLVGPGSSWLSEQGWAETQVGELPPLYLLNQWAGDWITVRAMRESLPEATAVALSRWFLDRLDWAMGNHPAIDEFVVDVAGIARSMRSVNRTGEKRGESAGRCPMVTRDDTACGTKLYVDPYMDYITCTRCGTMWDRRKGEWLKLRARQIEMEAA